MYGGNVLPRVSKLAFSLHELEGNVLCVVIIVHHRQGHSQEAFFYQLREKFSSFFAPISWWLF